jgi:hypothetical protein
MFEWALGSSRSRTRGIPCNHTRRRTAASVGRSARWQTVRDLAGWAGVGGFGPLFVGGPSTVADLLQEWVEETDVDGFNLTCAVAHETFADVAGYLVPELQPREAFRRDYTPGTLREKLFGGDARLGCDHPAAGYRQFAEERRLGALLNAQ